MKKSDSTVIFDLDGTVYQSFDFHSFYVNAMVENTRYASWEREITGLVKDILSGKKLRMNNFYRFEVKAVTSLSELENVLAGQIIRELSYKQAIAAENITYLGDEWAVLTFIGKTLGCLEGNRCDDVYFKTRRYMEDKGMRGNANLAKAIKDLQNRCRVILMTNSYKETADEFLEQLNFSGIFKTIVSSGRKPYKMVDNLIALDPDILEYPDKIISIGDHAFNDLMPIADIGGKTVWMNPFCGISEPEYDITFKTLEELADYLYTL